MAHYLRGSIATRNLKVILISLCIAGCGENRGEIEFCDIDNGRFVPEPLRLSIKEKRIFGSGATFDFKVIESELVKGFIWPFPLALPKNPSSTSMPERWELGGYAFTMTRLSSANPDWFLIHASPADQEHASIDDQRTTVLYSLSKGVLAIRWSSHFEDEAMAGEGFFCGTGRLDASTF